MGYLQSLRIDPDIVIKDNVKIQRSWAILDLSFSSEMPLDSQQIVQELSGSQRSLQQDKRIVEIGLIQISKRGIAIDRCRFDQCDHPGALQKPIEMLEAPGCISDIAADADQCLVAAGSLFPSAHLQVIRIVLRGDQSMAIVSQSLFDQSTTALPDTIVTISSIRIPK